MLILLETEVFERGQNPQVKNHCFWGEGVALGFDIEVFPTGSCSGSGFHAGHIVLEGYEAFRN